MSPRPKNTKEIQKNGIFGITAKQGFRKLIIYLTFDENVVNHSWPPKNFFGIFSAAFYSD